MGSQGTLWLAGDPETAVDSSAGPETRASVYLSGGQRTEIVRAEK